MKIDDNCIHQTAGIQRILLSGRECLSGLQSMGLFTKVLTKLPSSIRWREDDSWPDVSDPVLLPGWWLRFLICVYGFGLAPWEDAWGVGMTSFGDVTGRGGAYKSGGDYIALPIRVGPRGHHFIKNWQYIYPNNSQIIPGKIFIKSKTRKE